MPPLASCFKPLASDNGKPKVKEKIEWKPGSQGVLLEINIYTKTRRIRFQILHQDKDIMRSSFNHCIKTFGVNYRKSRELQGKRKELETDKAKSPSVRTQYLPKNFSI